MQTTDEDITYRNFEAAHESRINLENNEAHQALNYNILKTIFVNRRFDLYERIVNSTFPICLETCFPAHGYDTHHLVDLLLESG
jgi:hypothetical protein